MEDSVKLVIEQKNGACNKILLGICGCLCVIIIVLLNDRNSPPTFAASSQKISCELAETRLLNKDQLKSTATVTLTSIATSWTTVVPRKASERKRNRKRKWRLTSGLATSMFSPNKKFCHWDVDGFRPHRHSGEMYQMASCGNCTTPFSNGTIAVLGDSQTLTIMAGNQDLGQKLGACVLMFGKTSCIPFVDARVYHPNLAKSGAAHCTESNGDIFRFLREQKIRRVVLAARWDWYLGSGGGFWIRGPPHQYKPLDAKKSPPAKNDTDQFVEDFRLAFQWVLQRFQRIGTRLTVVGEIPDYEGVVHNPKKSECRPPKDCSGKEFYTRNIRNFNAQPTRKYFRKLAAEGKVEYLDPISILCSQEECNPWDGELLLYRDDDHLNPIGAGRLGPMLVKHFSPGPNR